MNDGRLRSFAEIECVHSNAKGEVLSVEKQTFPVSYALDNDGEPTDIRKE